MSVPPTFPCEGQVKWDQHGTLGLHTHAYVNHYGGSLTFLAEKIRPLVQENSLMGAQVLRIAGQDYAGAMLVIQHVLPLAHHGTPQLFKAFFSATCVGATGQ